MATVLAALGAVLIVLGGILGFLLSLGRGAFGGPFEGAFGALVYGIVAVVLGLLILVFSGYTHYRSRESPLVGGIILIVGGAITWSLVGGWWLVAVGAAFAVLAGIILTVQALAGQGHGHWTT